MSFLPDELKEQRFPCPNCKNIISETADICRFCSTPLTLEMKSIAIKVEIENKIKSELNGHKNTIIVGLVFFLIGLFMIVTLIIELKFSNSFNFNCLTPIFIIGGAVVIIKGLIGYREVKKGN